MLQSGLVAGVKWRDMKIQAVVLAYLVFFLGAGSVLGQSGNGAAEQHAARSASATPAAADPATADYVIGPDDMLSVVFWRDQQMSADVLVRPDGKISLPLLDDVQAAGLTPKQLRDRLVSEARRFMTEPIATVVVRQINSRRVYITGLVARPGQYPLTPSMTILQLIATAGGLQDYAKAKDIRVVRVENGRPVNLRFDYDEMTRETNHQPSRNIELKVGDTVIVP